eukprot:CFRG6406T1
MPGIKKEQHQHAIVKPSSTVFVRGLPENYTNDSLEELFGTIGPIKQCFIVKDKETNESKRFGFVKFALKEDATTCLTQLNGHVLGKNRKLQITYAEAKPATEGRSKGKKSKEKLQEGEEGESETLETTEKGDGVTEEGLEDAEEEQPHNIEDEVMVEAGDLVEGITDDINEAKPNEASHVKPKSERKAPDNADGRTVIIRNIPAGTNKKNIEKKCRKFGRIESFDMSTEDEMADTLTATVVYPDYTQARKAQAKLDTTLVGAVKMTAVIKSKDRAPSKKALLKSLVIVRNVAFTATEEDFTTAFSVCGKILEIRVPKKADGVTGRGFVFVQFERHIDAAKAVDTVNGKKIRGRVVAVDFAVPIDDYKKTTTAPSKTDKSSAEEVEEESDSEDDEENSEIENEDDDDTDEESSDEDESKTDTVIPPKQRVEDVQEGCTVFIRNVPFTSTEEDLKTTLSVYGKVVMSKLVIDRDTKRPKGTAFVKFVDRETAETVVREAKKAVVAEVFGGGKQQGKMCTVSDGGIQIQGRSLNITLAVDKTQAAKLEKESSGKPEEKSDKRNLRLAREGYVSKEMAASLNVSQEDLKRREKADQEKRIKLKDLRYFVSPLRLVVRNIPPKISERELNEAFTDAVILANPAAQPRTIVKKVNLMRNKENISGNGIGRSLGWAFIEFYSHEYALAGLRGTNNNPKLFHPNKRLIVDFAIENIDKVKVLEERKALQAEADAAKGIDKKTKRSALEDGGVKDGEKSTFKDFILQRQASRQAKRAVREANGQENVQSASTGKAKPSKRSLENDSHNESGAKRGRTDKASRSTRKQDMFLSEAQTQKPETKRAKRETKKETSIRSNEAKLDNLVASYKQKLFGSGASSSKKGEVKNVEKRWFA